MPAPGRDFCLFHTIPLSKPPKDVDWWRLDVCATQRMPVPDEPKLFDLLVQRAARSSAEDAPPPPSNLAQPLTVAEVNLLRRALAQPAIDEERPERIESSVHRLNDEGKAAARLVRLVAEFGALAGDLAIPIPACARASDVHWLLCEPAWVDFVKRVTSALKQREAPLLISFHALSSVQRKLRYLHAQAADQLVELAASDPQAALDAACARAHGLLCELAQLGLLEPAELQRPACELLGLLPGLLRPAPGSKGQQAQPYTGALEFEPEERAASPSVEAMRAAVREAARARAASAAGAARGGGPAAASAPLGFAHTAGGVRALSLLGQLALALDACGRLVEPGPVSLRVGRAYESLCGSQPEAMLPAPMHSRAQALPWLLGLPQWGASLLENGAPRESLAQLRACLAHHALAASCAEDAHLGRALELLAGAQPPGAQLRAAAREALRERARELVVRLAELERGQPAEEQPLADLLEIAQSPAKELVASLRASGTQPWKAMAASLHHARRRSLCVKVAEWRDAVWARLSARQDARAEDADALELLGQLGLALDSLDALDAQRAERKGKRRARASDGDGGDHEREGAIAPAGAPTPSKRPRTSEA